MTQAKSVGIVMRADGTVPFDDDLSDEHRDAIIGHLVRSGHKISHAEDGSHVRIHEGPMLQARGAD